MSKTRRKSPQNKGRPFYARGALACLWLLVLLVPLIFSQASHESFRLPKQLVSECLALASLVFLSWRLRTRETVDWKALLSHPAFVASAPLVLVATLGLLTTEHPAHVREGLAALWIGFASLVGWSVGLLPADKRRLVAATVVPAILLALLAAAQYHDLFEPFEFQEPVGGRIALTSLAGGAIDLSAYLVLPLLVLQLGLWRATSSRARWGWGLAIAVTFYGMVLTQTFTALAAFAAASFVLWLSLLERRRFLAVVALAAVVGGGLSWGVAPLRQRVLGKVATLERMDLNAFLTGRLDGWRAAWWMLGERPVRGVGQGAFTAEFANAKLALLAEGVPFFLSHEHGQGHFSSAHNELLEVAAECGWPGVLALAWGISVVVRRLWRTAAGPWKAGPPPDGQEAGTERHQAALLWAAATALAILSLTAFPFHLALVAYPYLLVLSQVLERPTH